jgi:phosphotriesterase-related protein
MSEESGVHVIATTGFNKHIYYPDWVEQKSVDEIAAMLVKDITEGGDGGSVRAGFIKIGTYYNLIHPLEEKTAIAAALAQRACGAPIWGHTEIGTMGMEILDILEARGVDFSTVALGHLDRNADEYYLLKLADRGIYIQFDGPGKVKYYPDGVRVALIKSLIAHGHAERMLISGDMGRASYLESYGGGPGFRFIKTKFIPRLIDEGVSPEDIEKIFLHNPQRWLGVF